MASMSDHDIFLGTKIDQLAELVNTGLSAMNQRVQGLESDAAEIRGLLRAIVGGIERLQARLPTQSEDAIEPMFDGEDPDDGFLTPPPGQFLH